MRKHLLNVNYLLNRRWNISLVFVCYSCKNEEVEEDGGGGMLGETIIRSKSNA